MLLYYLHFSYRGVVVTVYVRFRTRNQHFCKFLTVKYYLNVGINLRT